jgi:hypothetical protein
MNTMRALGFAASVGVVAALLLSTTVFAPTQAWAGAGGASSSDSDDAATRAKRTSLVACWGSVVAVAVASLLAKRYRAWWSKALVYFVLGVLALLPWLMLSYSTSCYWDAETDAGRTTVQWAILFWLIICVLWYVLVLYGLWARAYATLKRSAGPTAAPPRESALPAESPEESSGASSP